jgi:hypothetical protein
MAVYSKSDRRRCRHVRQYYHNRRFSKILWNRGLTGQIPNVSPGKEAFKHNINAFQGCAGAIIFLLDVDQEGHGVIEADYGKAIAVHVGGDRLGDGGIIVNFAFTIF